MREESKMTTRRDDINFLMVIFMYLSRMLLCEVLSFLFSVRRIKDDNERRDDINFWSRHACDVTDRTRISKLEHCDCNTEG
jgi:hypothetical protein